MAAASPSPTTVPSTRCAPRLTVAARWAPWCSISTAAAIAQYTWPMPSIPAAQPATGAAMPTRVITHRVCAPGRIARFSRGHGGGPPQRGSARITIRDHAVIEFLGGDRAGDRRGIGGYRPALPDRGHRVGEQHVQRMVGFPQPA